MLVFWKVFFGYSSSSSNEKNVTRVRFCCSCSSMVDAMQFSRKSMSTGAMSYKRRSKLINTADHATRKRCRLAANHFRTVNVIHYNRQELYILEVFTNAEDDH